MQRHTRRPHPGLRFLATLGVLSLLVLFAVLQFHTGDHAPSHRSLLPRDLPGGLAEEEECRHVRHVKDQCAFVKANCDDEDSGLFSYLDLYYCRLSHAKPVAFMIIICWAALLFTTIGVAASEFFSVNLSTIAALLRLSENVAGVTFLAFGNGSADVFSTFAAMKNNSGSLAVGELIGAAGFISAVVPGTMALIRPFKTGKSGFVRDIVLLAVAVSFSMVFLVNGRLEWWECVVMIVFYVFYASSVVFWHWWKERGRRKRERVALARGHFTVPEHGEAELQEAYRDQDSDEDEQTLNQGISTTDLQDLEDANAYSENDDGDDDDYDSRVTPQERERWLGELSSNMRVTRPPAGEIGDMTTPIRPSLIGALEFQALLASLQKARHTRSINLRRYSDDPTFTALQQQHGNGQHHDPGPAGNEAAVFTSYGLSRDGPSTTLEARANAGGRARAVSAADATGLGLDRRFSKGYSQRRAGGRSRLTKPTTATMESGSGPATDGTRQSNVPASSPLLTISEPDVDIENEGSTILSGQTETPTAGGYLAPPGEGGAHPTNAAKVDSSTLNTHLNEVTSTDNLRPQLKITPPPTPSRSRSRSRKSSPRPHLRSPLAPFLDDTDNRRTNRAPSLYLEDPALESPEPLLPVDTQDRNSPTSKPLRWWPYGVLPAPTVIMRTLFPTLFMWREKTLWQKALGVVSAPSLFLLTITLPVVQKPEPERQIALQTPQTPSQRMYRDEPSVKMPLIDRAGDHSPLKFAGQYGSTATAAVSIEEETLTNEHSTSSSPHEPMSRHPHEPELLTHHPKEWNRWLTIIQCFTAPWFVVLVVWANVWLPDLWALLKASLYSIFGSLLALAALLLTTTPTHPPRWRPVLSFAGFFVAVAWISTIADEVVGVLKTIGVICNISDAILGLTIFAVGNSLGDLVADITVARLGHPVMALSACFGGPMLNILLGIGLSGLYVTIHGAEKKHRKHPDRPWKFKPFHIQISTTLLISAGTLLATLVALLIFVPLNKWRIDRKIGIGLICLWVLATVANVAVELTIGSDTINSPR